MNNDKLSRVLESTHTEPLAGDPYHRPNGEPVRAPSSHPPISRDFQAGGGLSIPREAAEAAGILVAKDEDDSLRGLRIVPVSDFVADDEEGAAAILGEDDGKAVIPEGGDVMIYGDGGAGKTTLGIDLGCHLAAGDEWLGISVARPARVLLIENEGPRPHFRAKLRRKLEAWPGSEIGDRLQVLEEPWSLLTLDDDDWREALAGAIDKAEIDVVVLGPVTRAGMNDAGTLQEVRDFMGLIEDVRRRSGRPVVFVLIHHENKGGKVSGAWEGAGDTLLHVQGQGHGRTRVFIQKARRGSAYHGTSLQLTWAEGEGFTLADEPERDDETVADEILEAAAADPGASWTKIEQGVAGKAERLREIRDRLLDGGRLVNAGSETRMKLWHGDDPAAPESSRPDRDGVGTRYASAPGEAADEPDRVPRPTLRGTGTGRDAVPPDEIDENARLLPPQARHGGAAGVSADPVRAASAHPSVSSGNEDVVGLAVPRSPFLFAEDVAARYGVSLRWVHERTRDPEGAIPHRRMPRSRRCLFVESELEAWEAGGALEVRELAGGGRIVRPT